MSTQNLNTGPLRSSGHKEATEDHATAAKLSTMGDDGNPSALLKNRLASSGQVGRAALYDHDDFACVASSGGGFTLEADHVRKIFDGLLTYSRVDDPTAAGGAGQPPQHLTIGEEGKADVKNGDADRIVGTLNGKPFIAARTATFIVLVEGTDESDESALATVVQSFQTGLQELTL